MPKLIPGLTLCLALAPWVHPTVAAEAGHHAHWSYSGAEGPTHWADLDPAYAACAAGFAQSPVDVSGALDATLPPLVIDYQGLGQDVVNNGHTIQVNVAPGSTLTLDGRTFTLKQFHFHTPSEDKMNGESFAMEGHLVHADPEGHLAVISVLYRLGAENPVIAQVWNAMPERTDTPAAPPAPIDPAALLPTDKGYFRFDGSLTTPPCTEGVRWIVLKAPMTVSQSQVDRLTAAMHGANSRPVQPVNARVIAR